MIPIIEAVRLNDFEKTKQLIDSGSKVDISYSELGDTPLMWAVKFGNSKMIKLLIEAGASINKKNLVGHTVLHTAVINSKFQTLKELVHLGADINVRDIYGNTLLAYAYNYGNNDIVDFLKQNGLN